MTRRTFKSSAARLLAAACALAPTAAAHTSPTARAAWQQQTQAAVKEDVQRQAAKDEGEKSDEEVTRVSALFARGGRVAVDNRTTGLIRIVGWDRETVEAVAKSERGGEAVRVRIEETDAGRRVSFYADYAGEDPRAPAGETTIGRVRGLNRIIAQGLGLGLGLRGPSRVKPRPAPAVPVKAQTPAQEPPAKPATPAAATPAKGSTSGEPSRAVPVRPAEPAKDLTPTGAASEGRKISPPGGAKPVRPWALIKRPREIEIEVRVPRYAEVEPIRVIRSPVEVSNIDTAVRVLGDKSEVRLSQVGAADVRTTSGHVVVERAGGVVNVTTSEGDVEVRDSRGDVHARSIAGAVKVVCARGRVDATSVDGPVQVTSPGGDVEASTTTSDVRLSAAPRAGAHYNLKSMTGRVELFVEGNPAGFNAALSSYRGMISSDFPLQSGEDTTAAVTNRRRTGRFGDGRAQLTLDSFEGAVRLSRAAPGAAQVCR